MKNKTLIFILVVLVILIATAVYFSVSNKNNEENSYEANKTSSTETQNKNNETNDDQNVEENNKNETDKSEEKKEENNTSDEKRQEEYKEEQLSTFTTKIYSKDSERQNNIRITCNTLNNTTIKAGETFSFCSTVGKATSDKGYQEADVFDHNGNKTKGLRWWKLSSK